MTDGRADVGSLKSNAISGQEWDAATAAEVKEGYLLPADAKVLNQVAGASMVGG
jgi:hypothetical protein